MEVLALAPLHILIGLTNKLYFDARPSETSATKESRQLYKRHCLALLKAKVYRSDYWTGALEGNSCSRLLDAMAMGEIPFEVNANAYLDALRALKTVKDKCLGKTREMGWVESIRVFRDAWTSTSLPWSLKSHVLSDHYEKYFHHYESIYDAGAAISSEQSGEMLHSCLQKIWNLRFRTRETNQELYSHRIIDCMVTYNYNLKWDDAICESQKELSSLGNTMTTHDEAELMENINTTEDVRIQSHNWDTDISDED